MEPLYDRFGRVRAWLQEDVGRIVSPDGNHLAFIERESVYDWHRNHIGWWADGHMRDAGGAVVVWLATAATSGCRVLVSVNGQLDHRWSQCLLVPSELFDQSHPFELPDGQIGRCSDAGPRPASSSAR
jgi:4-fold beta-flower domain-containing protein